jgi:hypothetical protein
MLPFAQVVSLLSHLAFWVERVSPFCPYDFEDILITVNRNGTLGSVLEFCTSCCEPITHSWLPVAPFDPL